MELKYRRGIRGTLISSNITERTDWTIVQFPERGRGSVPLTISLAYIRKWRPKVGMSHEKFRTAHWNCRSVGRARTKMVRCACPNASRDHPGYPDKHKIIIVCTTLKQSLESTIAQGYIRAELRISLTEERRKKFSSLSFIISACHKELAYPLITFPNKRIHL